MVNEIMYKNLIKVGVSRLRPLTVASKFCSMVGCGFPGLSRVSCRYPWMSRNGSTSQIASDKEFLLSLVAEVLSLKHEDEGPCSGFHLVDSHLVISPREKL